MNFKSIESKLKALEEKRGPALAAFVVALAFMLLAVIYVRPAIVTVVLGKSYAILSADPFSDAPNRVGYRILTPLISYLLGLRGEGIIITNLLFALSFLAVIYAYFRKNLPNLNDALYGTAVFAFSLVTLTTIYYGGYCDSLTYLLVLLMWLFRSKMPLVSLFFLLGLLNRESIVFLAPWFVFLHLTESTHKVKTVFKVLSWYGLALGLYYLFRMWVGSFREVEFSWDYYVAIVLKEPFNIFQKSYGYQFLGLFSVFKALWIIPVLAVYSFWRNRKRREIVSALLLILGVWAQMFIAWDSSRLMTLVFPVMIISYGQVIKENPFGFRSWAMLLLVFNMFVPKLYTAANIIEFMNSTVMNVFEMLFMGKPSW